MLYTDQAIACAGCGAEFVFSVREQEFYAEKGFTSIPKRCKNCRNARKDQSGGSESYSNSYGAAPRERELHSVICAACGVETQVPFKPRGDRPVYCRACFQK